MLSNIRLENFKACRGLDLPINRLTVLAGRNSSGKSSILQSLALLSQSYERKSADGLELNGRWISLGTGRDVLCEDAETENISIETTEEKKKFLWTARSVSDAYVLPFIEKPQGLPPFLDGRQFQFLQADRITPATTYPNAPQYFRDLDQLGSRGEFTVDFLSRNREQEVSGARRLPDSIAAPTPKLLDQVGGWLQNLSPGVRVEVEQLKGTDSVRLAYRYGGRARNVASLDYRPTNVGFGLTYVLSIVVACLSAKKDGILLIENPEAHLHPQGQTSLGRLLGCCVRDEVQVIVETHSDHLLNGVRLAVKKSELPSDDVAIHFFTRNLEKGDVSVDSPKIFNTGRLSSWPSGFFDEWDKSLDQLLEG